MKNSIVGFTTVEPKNMAEMYTCNGKMLIISGFEKITLTSKAPGPTKRISFERLNQPQIDSVPDGTLVYIGDALRKEEDGSITKGFHIVDLKNMMQESYDIDKKANEAWKVKFKNFI